MKNIQAIRKRIILNPSVSKARGLIAVPETYQDASTSCLVVSAGADCNPALKPGVVALCAVGFAGRKEKINEEGHFWAEEKNIYGIVKNNTIFPIGRTILIKRDVQEIKVGSIVIPENRRAQSLTGTVLRFGITRDRFRVQGINKGDRIQLVQWEPHMLQIQLEDGSEGLIVLENDLLCKYEETSDSL